MSLCRDVKLARLGPDGYGDGDGDDAVAAKVKLRGEGRGSRQVPASPRRPREESFRCSITML